MEESSESILTYQNGMYVANGSMKVVGNLETTNQISADSIMIAENSGN